MVNSSGSQGSRPSGLWPPVGTLSKDRVAIIGRDQFAFLFGGANAYYDGYFADGRDCAAGWLAYCEQAERRLARMGVTFHLIVVPNKATLLPQHYPLDLGRDITDPLARLVAARPSWLMSLLDDFRADPARDAIFRRNDSHLTSYGNIVLSEAILKRLGLARTIDFGAFDTGEVTHSGDLGSRFDPPAEELFRTLQLPRQSVTVRQLSAPVGQHVGLSFEIDNPDGVYANPVAIFGNSFFEKYESWGATPVFARFFTKLYFKWTNEVDFAVVERLRPKHVFIQTCERFLRTWPSQAPDS